MKYRQTSERHPVPLSPQVFQILIALFDGPRHGYGVIQDIRERTGDEIRLTASTLYDALARLHDQGWIEETEGPGHDEPIEGRRRYYRLTANGREAAQQETARLERLLATVRGTPLLRRKRA